MPSKLDLPQPQTEQAKQITGSFGEWTSFLKLQDAVQVSVP